MKQMKQCLCALLALVLLLGMLPLQAGAEGVEESIPETTVETVEATLPTETETAAEAVPEEILLSGEAEPLLAGSSSCGNNLTWELSGGTERTSYSLISRD